MNKDSRTYKTLKNSVVALLYYAANLFISFFSRRVFLHHLGSEVLGLNTTVSSLLSFLNLAELGIGTAIGVTLYKPIAENDQKTINEIVSLQGWFYQKVAFVIMAGAIILMFFFPRIFANTSLPLWYAYGSFIVFLFGSLISYFITYKQIVLAANQQNYIVTRSYSSFLLIKLVVQMIAVSIFENGYVWWLVIEFAFSLIANSVLYMVIKRYAPNLVTNTKKGPSLRKKYPDVLKKVKQLFIHTFSSFVLNQTSPIIIYAFASLTLVTEYSNYVLITGSLISLVSAVFNGMNAGVGNLVAESNITHIYAVFRELFSSRFVIIAAISYCFYKLATPFVSIWLGMEFILNNTIVLLIAILFFIRGSRQVIDNFINAYGLYFDIWAPAAEAAINIGCSILFGHLWGLTGILSGVLLSQILIIFIWKPILLHRYGFKIPIRDYVLMYAKHLGLYTITILLLNQLYRVLPFDPSSGYLQFFWTGTILTISFFMVQGVLQYGTEKGTRDFVNRMWNQVILKRND